MSVISGAAKYSAPGSKLAVFRATRLCDLAVLRDCYGCVLEIKHESETLRVWWEGVGRLIGEGGGGGGGCCLLVAYHLSNMLVYLRDEGGGKKGGREERGGREEGGKGRERGGGKKGGGGTIVSGKFWQSVSQGYECCWLLCCAVLSQAAMIALARSGTRRLGRKSTHWKGTAMLSMPSPSTIPLGRAPICWYPLHLKLTDKYIVMTMKTASRIKWYRYKLSQHPQDHF